MKKEMLITFVESKTKKILDITINNPFLLVGETFSDQNGNLMEVKSFSVDLKNNKIFIYSDYVYNMIFKK